MSADSPRNTKTGEEVTRLKRFSIVAAIVVVAALVAVPATFAGARPVAPPLGPTEFVQTASCEACHAAANPPASEWAETAHAGVLNNAEPVLDGVSCAGCHSGNYDPGQPLDVDLQVDPVTEEITGTGLGNNPTEAFVGCATCHYSAVTTHKGSAVWNPGNPDYNPLDYGQFANPDVCGQCHNRYSQSVAEYPVYNEADPATPTPTFLRYWPAYDPYTTPLAYSEAVPDGVMDIGGQGWTTWPGGQSKRAHEFSAVQYNEMSTTYGHFNSLAALKGLVTAGYVEDAEAVNLCSHCMSADQRILVEAGKLNTDTTPPFTDAPTDSQGNPVTMDDLKYGDTCVACHDPHAKGESTSVWNEERNAQLILPRKQLCGTCHNGELELNTPGATSFAPGAEINHPTQEFMSGIGAIEVPKMPALHKGMCVQCHMVPTGFDREGNPATGGNHVFAAIMPEEAMTQTTETANPNFDDTLPPDPVTNPETIIQHMPYSACSTCHAGTNGDNYARTQAMQQIIDDRQAWTHEMVDAVMATLDAKAVQMGYADAEAAIANADVANSDFGKAWTNMQLVAQEGSWGVHNWQYGVAVINKAMEQADAFRVPVAKVTIVASAAKIVFGKTVSLSGTVTTPAGGPALMDGDMVRLWVNGAPTSFATLSGGSYSFTGVKPTKTTTFTIQFVGDANYAPTVGDSTKVDVAYKVTITSNKTSVTAGARVIVQGTVAPTAGPVTIQRYTNGAWRTFKSGVSVNSQGRYSYQFTAKKGTYKLRTVKAASATLVQGASGFRTIAAR